MTEAIAKACGRVAVLYGGTSAEREVSLKSGNAVFNALLEVGVDAFQVDLTGDMLTQLQGISADRVFNVLHGRGGEDGTVQAVLDYLKLPYTGSGLAASAISMDKLATKRILAGSGIPTPDYIELANEEDCQRLLDTIGLPVFVKPALEGSSIGMTLVRDVAELIPAWQKASAYGVVFAEQFIDGIEYTAGFLGSQVLPLIKLETPRTFYDYKAKYISNDTIYTCPCGLPQDAIEPINDLVEQTIHVTGTRHWGRVDLMMDKSGQPWVIEINTVPGMTDHSLVPIAAKQAGLAMPELVLRILELTLTEADQHG